MKRLLATIPLLAALLSAWGQSEAEHGLLEPALSTTPEEMRRQLSAMHDEAQEMEMHAPEMGMGALPEAPFDPDSPMPEPPPGQSAAAADGGLIFDNADSRLTYIGNVRLNDPHLQMRAAHRLYIRLPKHEQKEHAAAQAPEAKQPKPQARDSATPAAPKKQEAEQAVIPAFLTVEHAAVDVPGSRVLLVGRQAEPSLTLTRAQDSMVLQTAADGSPARVFSDAEGNVLVEGSRMVFIWHDEKGQPWKLEAAAGPVLYSGADACLRVWGQAHLFTPSGDMECDESLTIVFAEPPSAATPKDSPFAAFSAMQFREVKLATAKGHVSLTTPATDTRPAGIAKSDSMAYDATTGDCVLSGNCFVAYGGSTLATHGKIQLLPNGDALISSTSGSIGGAYERPAPGNTAAAAICGTWSTPGNVLYDAQKNCFIFPRGLTAQDASASFSCTEELQVYTTPAPSAAPSAPKPGLPNLAIARQEDVQRIVAAGEVRLHSEASASAPACDLMGDTLDATLTTGEATLTAAAGHQAYARYGEHLLTSTAAAQGEASICLLPNGDLTAQGEKISATLPGEKGTTHMTCSRMLHLRREAALLTLGENSRLESPEGILTARAQLHAELERGTGPSRAPKKYPHLDYNFTGLHRASTPGGGTVRTTQASMQCEGAIAVELAPGASTGGDPRKNLRAAMARNRVSVAGKDSTGRLLRANGDRLDFDPTSGNFYLRGSTVSLADRYNTHTASGAGACVTIDPQNNVHITGQRQATLANHVKEQMEKNKKK